MNAPLAHPPTVRTACPYCGVGCGILAKPDGRGGAEIVGDPAHPANFGKLCSKGAALAETLGLEGRLLHPLLRQRDGAFARVSWDDALDRVAGEMQRIVAQHGPGAVAFYLSGQLLTEDYYVANKLMKGFVGGANVDTNSRLCMASSVAGHRRAFGSDTVPGTYQDIDEADLIVLVGSNAAWCHPILFQRMVAARRARGARMVVVDPRRTATAEDADLFLGIAPGQDTALLSGLLVHLADSGALDQGYIESHTTGFAAALARAREIAGDRDATARATGLVPADVAQFFDWFAATRRVVTCFSQGVNQSAQGTDKVNAIINCHLATGRIGRPGMGPLSLTGQPNAMGGREVGGLANQLAAHMGFAPGDVDRVGRFWKAPRIAQREGLKAVAMFDAIARGDIRALWVMATNPAVSLPRAAAMREALSKLELLVVSDNVIANDTTAGAHVLLPAAAWGEKDGTVTNSERRISRQRRFLPAPAEAKPDWWIVCEVAKRLGFADAFSYASAAEIFREHAALSRFENDGTRDFDLGELAGLTDTAYDALDPVQWGGGEAKRFFAEGGFFTPDRKARFIAPERPASKQAVSEDLPFRLNTGRVRDQWHTMTRSGLSPLLARHCPEPFVEVHPHDAAAAGLTDGGFARVSTRHGACLLKVVVDEGQRPGMLFAPIHWSDTTASHARVGALVGADTDPHSGQPDAKATPAALAAMSFAYRGFAVAREPFALPPETWWARVALSHGVGFLFATDAPPATWRARVPSMFGTELAEYVDAPRDTYRVAAFSEGRLAACLFVGPSAAAPQWDSIAACFAAETLGHNARRMLLSGRSAENMPETGPLVCTCFGVGLNAIRDALLSREAASVEDIGRALKAGTNCGSCLPELRKILKTTTVDAGARVA